MSTVDLAILADLLADQLASRCADPSPVRDESETDVVDQNATVSMAFAEDYVARRMTYAIGRLRVAAQFGDVIHDGLIVLGAYAHLLDLQAGVKA